MAVMGLWPSPSGPAEAVARQLRGTIHAQGAMLERRVGWEARRLGVISHNRNLPSGPGEDTTGQQYSYYLIGVIKSL